MPVLLIVAFFSACSSDENLDFQIDNSGLPLSLIEIYAPVDGSVIAADTDFVVDYEVVRGKRGAYVDIRVDRQEPMRVKSLKGRHRVQGLKPGSHTLLIVERAADGKKTGGVAKIEFVAE